MVNNSCKTVASGNNTSKLVFKIVKQISHKRISISLHQLLKIVKPEIHQEIINSIANSDISQRNRILSKVKRKKRFLNDTASESSSGSDSESESGSDSVLSIDGMCIRAVKAKKRD